MINTKTHLQNMRDYFLGFYNLSYKHIFLCFVIWVEKMCMCENVSLKIKVSIHYQTLLTQLTQPIF
jgi:hypothetical protein